MITWRIFHVACLSLSVSALRLGDTDGDLLADGSMLKNKTKMSKAAAQPEANTLADASAREHMFLPMAGSQQMKLPNAWETTPTQQNQQMQTGVAEVEPKESQARLLGGIKLRPNHVPNAHSCLGPHSSLVKRFEPAFFGFLKSVWDIISPRAVSAIGQMKPGDEATLLNNLEKEIYTYYSHGLPGQQAQQQQQLLPQEQAQAAQQPKGLADIPEVAEFLLRINDSFVKHRHVAKNIRWIQIQQTANIWEPGMQELIFNTLDKCVQNSSPEGIVKALKRSFYLFPNKAHFELELGENPKRVQSRVYVHVRPWYREQNRNIFPGLDILYKLVEEYDASLLDVASCKIAGPAAVEKQDSIVCYTTSLATAEKLANFIIQTFPPDYFVEGLPPVVRREGKGVGVADEPIERPDKKLSLGILYAEMLAKSLYEAHVNNQPEFTETMEQKKSVNGQDNFKRYVTNICEKMLQSGIDLSAPEELRAEPRRQGSEKKTQEFFDKEIEQKVYGLERASVQNLWGDHQPQQAEMADLDEDEVKEAKLAFMNSAFRQKKE